MISANNMRSMAPYLDAGTAAAYAFALDNAREFGDLFSNIRVRHFMAQIAEETGGFRALVENLHYTNPDRLHEIFPHEVPDRVEAAFLIRSGPEAIANRVYANRNGNGDEASGDGWRYKGRGFIGITGKANYRTIGADIGMDLVDNPELLETPNDAAEAACKFWGHFGCNTYADHDDIVGVTRIVNGPGMEGLDQPKQWYIKAKVIWP